MFVSGRLPLAAHPQGGGLGRLTELPKVRGRQRSKPRLLCSTLHAAPAGLRRVLLTILLTLHNPI